MIKFKLNTVQKEIIAGQEFAPHKILSPIQDINDDWFICLTYLECNEIMNTNFKWILDLSQGEYIPKEQTPFVINP
jgi:hypothetical protein